MGLLKALSNVFGKKQVDLEQRFEFGRKWIQGSCGRFHLVKEKDSGKTYGVKMIDREKSKQFRDRFESKFKSEAAIALELQHPAIVKAIEIGTSMSRNDFILMEYCHGQLLEEAIGIKNSLVQKNAIKLIGQLAEAVQFIHKSGFIHRDICPRNIFVDSQFKSLKLFDFGLAVPNEPEFRLPKNRTGTPIYMAPEIVRRRETSLAVDLFAFGITAYQIMTFVHPWGVEENTSKSALLFDSRKPTDIREHLPNLQVQIAEAIMHCLEA
ncbi:MAG: serine/threonine-protein kinase, partial [Planctomycetota bacterium]